jgi:hypothetical protein
MDYSTAKRFLVHAQTFQERAEAIEIAISLGVALHEIEQNLDWLDGIGQGSFRDCVHSEERRSGTVPVSMGIGADRLLKC